MSLWTIIQKVIDSNIFINCKLLSLAISRNVSFRESDNSLGNCIPGSMNHPSPCFDLRAPVNDIQDSNYKRGSGSNCHSEKGFFHWLQVSGGWKRIILYLTCLSQLLYDPSSYIESQKSFSLFPIYLSENWPAVHEEAQS